MPDPTSSSETLNQTAATNNNSTVVGKLTQQIFDFSAKMGEQQKQSDRNFQDFKSGLDRNLRNFGNQVNSTQRLMSGGSDRFTQTMGKASEMMLKFVGLGGLSGFATDLFRSIKDMNNQYIAMNEVGQTFQDGMFGLSQAAASTGNSLDEYSKLLRQNASVAGRLGNDGFNKLLTQVKTTSREFGYFGYSLDDLQQTTMDYNKALHDSGRLGTGSLKDASLQATLFAKAIADASVSGRDRKSIEKGALAAMHDDFYKILTMKAAAGDRGAQAKVKNDDVAIASLGQVSDELQKLFAQMAGTGGLGGFMRSGTMLEQYRPLTMLGNGALLKQMDAMRQQVEGMKQGEGESATAFADRQAKVMDEAKLEMAKTAQSLLPEFTKMQELNPNDPQIKAVGEMLTSLLNQRQKKDDGTYESDDDYKKRMAETRRRQKENAQVQAIEDKLGAALGKVRMKLLNIVSGPLLHMLNALDMLLAPFGGYNVETDKKPGGDGAAQQKEAEGMWSKLLAGFSDLLWSGLKSVVTNSLSVPVIGPILALAAPLAGVTGALWGLKKIVGLLPDGLKGFLSHLPIIGRLFKSLDKIVKINAKIVYVNGAVAGGGLGDLGGGGAGGPGGKGRLRRWFGKGAGALRRGAGVLGRGLGLGGAVLGAAEVAASAGSALTTAGEVGAASASTAGQAAATAAKPGMFSRIGAATGSLWGKITSAGSGVLGGVKSAGASFLGGASRLIGGIAGTAMNATKWAFGKIGGLAKKVPWLGGILEVVDALPEFNELREAYEAGKISNSEFLRGIVQLAGPRAGELIGGAGGAAIGSAALPGVGTFAGAIGGGMAGRAVAQSATDYLTGPSVLDKLHKDAQDPSQAVATPDSPDAAAARDPAGDANADVRKKDEQMKAELQKKSNDHLTAMVSTQLDVVSLLKSLGQKLDRLISANSGG